MAKSIRKPAYTTAVPPSVPRVDGCSHVNIVDTPHYAYHWCSDCGAIRGYAQTTGEWEPAQRAGSPVLSRFVLVHHADCTACAVCGADGYGVQVLVTRARGRSHVLVCEECLGALDGRPRKP